MRTSSKLVAGLADAAAAAGSTFLAGLIAIRNLDGDVLALYVILFSSTVLAMTLPRQLTYIPSELKANLQSTVVSPAITRDAGRAVPFDALTALIVALSGVALLGRVPATSYVALVVTAAVFAVLSPLQDHLRNALHLVGRHWSAASLSLVLASVVGATSAVALLAPPAKGLELMPFGSLLVGKAASIALGAFLLRGADRFVGYRQEPFLVRARFLLAEVVVQTAWFGCNLAVLWFLSGKALGDLEAARVAASPLNIVVVGLLSFMYPTLLRALSADRADAGALRARIVRLYSALVGAGALYFLLIVVFVDVVTVVFDRPTDLALVGARLGAVLAEGLSIVIVQLIFAMGRSGLALGLSVVGAVVGLAATVALLPLLGVFALPAGQALGMVVRLVAGVASVPRVLRGRAAVARPDEPDPAVDEMLVRQPIEEETAQ